MRAGGRVEGLYGIADGGFRPEIPIEQKVRGFLDGGAGVVQVRLKSASARELWEAVCRAVELARGRARVVVNDRPDVALAARADGVHVGDEDLPVALVRRIVGPDMLLGVTVRSVEQALQAARDGADYVGFGPIFATSTKSVGAPPQGLAALERVVAACPIPVVAIAGITLERAAEIARTGAAGAAVVADVLGAEDPVERARAFSAEFAAAASKGRR